MDKAVRLFGKQQPIKRIQDMYFAGRLPHSIMLSGDKGLGKKQLAIWLASLMLCENADNGSPCFNCRSCRNIVLAEHADVIYAMGEKYTADSVRENVQLASFYPSDGNLRVFIFEDCDKMSAVQQNILLKAIEEPSEYNRYIFTCENTSLILPTIMSRVVNIPVAEMSCEECEECLVFCGIDKAAAREAVVRYGTNPGRVMSVLYDKKQSALYDSADKIAEALAQINEYNAAKELAKYTDRQELMSLIGILYEKLSRAALPAVPEEKTEKELKEQLSLKKLYRLSDKLSDILTLADTNFSAKLFSASVTAQLFEILQ